MLLGSILGVEEFASAAARESPPGQAARARRYTLKKTFLRRNFEPSRSEHTYVAMGPQSSLPRENIFESCHDTAFSSCSRTFGCRRCATRGR